MNTMQYLNKAMSQNLNQAVKTLGKTEGLNFRESMTYYKLWKQDKINAALSKVSV